MVSIIIFIYDLQMCEAAATMHR